MHAEITKGDVLEISNSLSIMKDYTVLHNGIPVGTAKDNLCWFSNNPNRPEYFQIKQVVYLGNYEWGVKQLTSPIDEFESFDHFLKDEIIRDFLSMQKEFHEYRRRDYDLL